MKRGTWGRIILLSLGFLIIGMIALVNAKTYNFKDCWGVKMCNANFSCGTYDGFCADDFFENGSLPALQGGCIKNYTDEGYPKCIDPDCKLCINGTIIRAPPNLPEPVVNATVTYEQDVWDGTEVTTITLKTTTNEQGVYSFNVSAGNEIYLIAEGESFTPELVGPIFNVDKRVINEECLTIDFGLKNGSCMGDCTRMGNNYCDAGCQGAGSPDDLCLFNTTQNFQASDGQNVIINSPLNTCTKLGIQQGAIVDLGNFTHLNTTQRTCVKVSCCEGNPFEVPCPETNISETLAVSGINLENAIKITRISNDKGEPVKLKVYYWE